MEIERWGRAEEIAASVQRAMTGGPMRDTLRELSLRAQEVEYYRWHYEAVVPRDRRVQSFTQSRSSRSRDTRLGSKSRGVTGPSRHDPPRDPGVGTSGAKPSLLGDSHT